MWWSRLTLVFETLQHSRKGSWQCIGICCISCCCAGGDSAKLDVHLVDQSDDGTDGQGAGASCQTCFVTAGQGLSAGTQLCIVCGVCVFMCVCGGYVCRMIPLIDKDQVPAFS